MFRFRQTARPDYGLDAPGLGQGLLAASTLSAGLGLIVWRTPSSRLRFRPVIVGGLLAVAAYLQGLGGLMRYASTVGKLHERERLLDLISWSGDETVLDAGCGRGLMLVGAAKRLTTGRAVGVDIWRAVDQSNNGPDAALENARLEGVASKVEIETADVRTLPFDTASFDVVVSHWLVHNLPGRAGRAAAIREMVRVLRPGGTLIIADIQHHDEYVAILAECGVQEVRRLQDTWHTTFFGVVSFGVFHPSAVIARTTGSRPSPGGRS